MKQLSLFGNIAILFSAFYSQLCFAHGDAHYLGNSAVLVQTEQKKILFDPFFHNDFGIYQLVPETMHSAIMAGAPPYDDIDAIVISHAHEDHFSAYDVAEYLSKFPDTVLVAPQQAIDMLKEYLVPKQQLHAFNLDFKAAPEQQSIKGMQISALRIPHAGWPGRKDVQNLVFRVQLGDNFSAMHMGDADPDDSHYLPYEAFWQEQMTSVNFPPYWFFMSAEGRDILYEILNVKKHIGVHVPKQVPKYLKDSDYRYFSTPGEVQSIE